MKDKILILGSFPAPYRVEVFNGIASQYDADIFFYTDKDQNRSKDYFVKKERYFVLSCSDDKRIFNECLKNLRRYKLVIAYDWYLPFAVKVELMCIFYNIPYIINCDGAFLSDKVSLKKSIKECFKSFFVKRAAKCWASGNYAKKYFLHYKAMECNIVKHNFTSLHTEDILTAPVKKFEKDELKKELGLSNKKMVLSIGQFIYRKGFDVLLKAWENMDNDFQLVIIGGGEEKDNYLHLIREHNLQNVKLIDFKPKADIFKYYMASDIFVLPTREDIWGLVINEAMACGLPIVATNKCIAAMELIKGNGIIVDPDSTEQLKNAIYKILTDEKLYLEFANNSVRLIQGNTVDAIYKSHIDVINGFFRGE